MTQPGTGARPLRIAIVGSGPSAFFAAEALFRSPVRLLVDMFDRLPTPFGLVRGGVAPDHPKIRRAAKAHEKTAAHEGFSFLGNVTVGRDVSVDELRAYYDAIIFAYGAETDRRLGIPGEDLPGSHTATEFVGWYNAHPDYADRAFDLSGDTAVVIGQGNVAVDVCRILCKTVDELRGTDISQAALDVLAESRLKDIYLIGRRGPVQAKFTSQELRELGHLADCDPVVNPDELHVDPLSQTELDDPKNTHSAKNLELLTEFAQRPLSGKNRRCHIRFFRSPIELRGAELRGAERINSVVFERNELVGEPFHQRARGTGIHEELPCSILFRSVGYRGLPMPGVPFDEPSGTIPNLHGRVTAHGAAQGAAHEAALGTILPGVYAAGWIKRGPSGIIGTNKPDSLETANALLEDIAKLEPCREPDTAGLHELLRSRGVRVVSFEDWKRIEQAEIERGQARGKPCERFRNVEEMLAVLDALG